MVVYYRRFPNSASNPQPYNGAVNVLTSQTLSWDDQRMRPRIPFILAPIILFPRAFGSYRAPILSARRLALEPPTIGVLTPIMPAASPRVRFGLSTLWTLPRRRVILIHRTLQPTFNGQILNWCAAAGATSYDVYFDIANPPSFAQNQTDNSYAPSMNPGTPIIGRTQYVY